MKPKRTFFISKGLPVIAACMLLYALIFAFGHKSTPAAQPTLPPPSSPYQDRVAGIGLVEPQSENIDIGTHLPGVVTTIHAHVGDKVKQGDALFTIDDRQTKAELDLAKAQLESAKVQAADARHQLSLYEKVSDKRAISNDELSQRRFAAQLADTRVKEAQAQVLVLSTQLDRLTVKAPMDGQVLKINIRPGEYAVAGANHPLIIFGNTDITHVRVEIDETDAMRVDPTAPATATLRGLTGEAVKLTFVRKEAYVMPKSSLTGDGNERVDTRTQQIIYSFDNSQLKAYVGQQMDVFIEAKPIADKK